MASSEAGRPPDDELVRRARQGDRAAGDALFRRYRNYFRTVAMARGVHFQDVDDVVQTACVNMWYKLGQLRGTFKNWATQIVRNEAGQHFRSLDGALVPLPDADPPASGGAAPDDVIFKETLDRVMQCLEALAPNEREAVEMKLKNPDGTWEEFAARVGKPSGTVRSHWSRGLKKLRKCLGKE